jgi:Spy/CpxP family protein refolding chaperone
MRKRLLGVLGTGAVALAMGLGGVAQASHGADDPPGHHQEHNGKDHHHGKHHGKHHHHHGNDDGPNHT